MKCPQCHRAPQPTLDPRWMRCPVCGVVKIPPTAAPLARNTDAQSAHDAAAKIAPKRGKIQREVIAAYREHGPMTFTVAEKLPEFRHYGRSTIQKRISELSQLGILERVPETETAQYQLNEARILDPLTPPKCPTCGRVWSNSK